MQSNPGIGPLSASSHGPDGFRSRRRRRRGARGRRRHPWRHRIAVLTASIVVFLALVAGAGYAYVEYRNHQIHHIVVGNLVPVQTKSGSKGGPDVGVQTFLMIGSTSRCAL